MSVRCLCVFQNVVAANVRGLPGRLLSNAIVLVALEALALYCHECKSATQT